MENETDLFSDLMTAYLAQMDSAMKITKIVSEHSHEEELTADSVLSGLIYRSMIPMSDDEMKDSLSEAQKIINDEYEIPSPDLDEYEEGDKVVLSRKLKQNTCDCDVCIKVRECIHNYHLHETSDNLSQIFKDAIDNACVIHKINI
jgi:hypothetical protein